MTKAGQEIERLLKKIVEVDDTATGDNTFTVVQLIAVMVSDILTRKTNTAEKLRYLRHVFGRCAGRLDEHINVECKDCKMQPILGLRYVSKDEPKIDLCSLCFSKQVRDRDVHKFERYRYQWEYLSAGRIVPDAPLRFKASGVDVMFLQYLLTRIGCLDRSHYNLWCGYYGAYTEDAVRRFRKHHGLPEKRGYDKQMKEVLCELVKDLPPTDFNLT